MVMGHIKDVGILENSFVDKRAFDKHVNRQITRGDRND